jgi:hypothetical protein
MTPQEKAQELVDKYLTMENTLNIIDLPYLEMSKQCALICVNELLTFREALFINEGSMAYLYLKEVKEEIEKI